MNTITDLKGVLYVYKVMAYPLLVFKVIPFFKIKFFIFLFWGDGLMVQHLVNQYICTNFLLVGFFLYPLHQMLFSLVLHGLPVSLISTLTWSYFGHGVAFDLLSNFLSILVLKMILAMADEQGSRF